MAFKHLVSLSLGVLVLGSLGYGGYHVGRSRPQQYLSAPPPVPLVMMGGNPYIRALMRTISASEANDPSPYTILYGGHHVDSLDQHPDRCLPILVGPNVGKCSTAAGRYQLITTTWLEIARRYHPQPNHFIVWNPYSFQSQYQDKVVYNWLTDPHEWGIDIPALLQAGQLSEVLRTLSPTWTSLGYGIEDNAITNDLPQIYQQLLQEELGIAQDTLPEPPL
jgi:muramidase (phage lysozyme)